jgi:hypothetical protein
VGRREILVLSKDNLRMYTFPLDQFYRPAEQDDLQCGTRDRMKGVGGGGTAILCIVFLIIIQS